MAKTHLIIGGSSGIGRELTRLLSQDGEIVFEGSRRALEDPVAGVNHFTYDVLADDKLPEDLIELDSLIYCPGSINLRPFHRLTEDDFLQEYKINVTGAVQVIQQALPMLKKSESGSIVLFSTVAVSQGMPFHSSTASAKGAVEALGRSLAAELAPTVKVNVIAPSIVNTPLAGRLLSTPEKTSASAQRHPLQRVGDPVEIANFIKMLVTQNPWMTGQVIHIDGGMSSVKVA